MIDWIPYVLGIGAIGVSIFSVWINHLKPFTLKTSLETPKMALFKVGKKGDKIDFLNYDVQIDELAEEQEKARKEEENYDYIYWIPSVAFVISFFNDGKKTGLIKNIRVTLTRDAKEKPNKFVLYADGIYHEQFQKNPFDEGRENVHKQIEQEWKPIFLSSHETKTLHILCEGHLHWGERLTGRWELEIEYLKGEKNEWSSIFSMGITLHQHSFDLGENFRFSNMYAEEFEEFDNGHYNKNLLKIVKTLDAKKGEEDKE